jgi:hypothetical protein
MLWHDTTVGEEVRVLKWRGKLGGCAIAIVLAAVSSGDVRAQGTLNTKDSVYVREVRVDGLLVEAGVDTSGLRRVIATLLYAAHQLSRAVTDSTPSLDVTVTVPRSIAGGVPEPRALVRFEVGRNLMEAGATDRLAWERSVTLPESPTWRALSGLVRRAVTEGVEAYVYRAAGT